MDKLKALNQGHGVVAVVLMRDHVRPETLPDTRHFLIEAISTAGGYKTLIVDVSRLDHKDMMFGLKYRDGRTTRADADGMPIHNPSSGESPTLAKELLYINKILGFLGKTLIIAGADQETRQMMHKSKIDRVLTLKDTMENAVEEMQAIVPGQGWSGTSDTVPA